MSPDRIPGEVRTSGASRRGFGRFLPLAGPALMSTPDGHYLGHPPETIFMSGAEPFDPT